jgi:hypothetical protein
MRGDDDHDSTEFGSNCGEPPVVTGEGALRNLPEGNNKHRGFCNDDTETIAGETAIELPVASEKEKSNRRESIPAASSRSSSVSLATRGGGRRLSSP